MSNIQSLYWRDMSKLRGETTIDLVETHSGTNLAVYLSETIFYPQGGGQPSDVGRIESSTGVLDVRLVKANANGVRHCGMIVEGQIYAGQKAQLIVDADMRLLHSRLHSAGELICAALKMKGRNWPVISAVHFPAEAKVVVDVSLDEIGRVALKEQLEQAIADIIRRDLPIRCEFVEDQERLAELCGYVPDYLPPDEPVRLVTLLPGFARPCMGTHVNRVSDIGQITIRNVKSKKGKTSIGYDIA